MSYGYELMKNTAEMEAGFARKIMPK